jgi:hypothetical protein
MRDAKVQQLFGGMNDKGNLRESWRGVELLGEGKREAPAQAELRPTCAGAAPDQRWKKCK